ncbi:TonB-dependent receptor [Cyclobacterium sp. 1_MG-2023]|uniref:SusC/RagA family TonB-linked outer membrane protein n=1 Tax=Cyclobacterium sp. 1_MG-2023 TaxID=3062681 RepID=UPI0026E2DB6F|nr:TonB-dependent receptor [Cyclobacterium sp. 1_MG-2023]MDO6438975.1 TonB-dependent receptor [Cyclobacterium sp. 1_MG-2023]
MKKRLLKGYLSIKILIFLMAIQLFYPNIHKGYANTIYEENRALIETFEINSLVEIFRVDVTITGTVTDENGEPIPGATISLPGTTIGTATDLDGKYSLTVPEESELVFSFIGFESQRVMIGDRSIIDVTLVEATSSLDEVVVVGFGTQKRANVTGAVSTVSGEDLARRPVVNTASALQGTTPGLTIQNNGGAPGDESTSIRIRGVGTLNNSNPLILVDGVEQSLSTVEPTNIASITVLKDAASSAIYGSRAANGVILVTTKRGEEGEVKISYNNFVGWQNPNFFPEPTDPVTWMRLENEAQANVGASPTYSETYIENVAAGTNPLEYPFADYEGGIFNPNAFQQRHSVSLSSGGKSGRIFASVNYSDTDGILQNFNNKQVTMRINSDMYASDKLTIKTNLMYRNRGFSGPGFTGQRITQALLHINRNIVMEYPDGTYDLVSGQWNARAMVQEGETSRVSDDVFGQLGFAYTINEALSLEGNVTLNTESTDGFIFQNSLAGMRNYVTGELVNVGGWFATSQLTESQDNQRELSQRLYLNYDQTFDKHSIQGTAGYEEIYNRFKQITAYRDNFFSNDLRDINAGDVQNQRTGGYSQEWRLRSFFGRANYSFDDRYMFQANVRYDGSSRFGEGKRWGVFPSFSAGWRISEEDFLKDGSLFSDLRLRGSWGQLGNQSIGLYRYLNTYNLGTGYQFNNNLVPGTAITSAGNPDITWETTTMSNIGLDMGFMDDRIEVIAEYFYKYTDDILIELPIPRTIGYDPPVQNAAAVSNKGWELAVNYHGSPASESGFQYSVGINFSDVVNKIEDLKGTGPFFPDKFTVWTEGESINSLRGLKSPGIYKTQEDLDNYPATIFPTVTIGDIIYEDLNGDGVISQSLYPAGDQYIMGNEDPRYEFGVRFNASYKGFDFSMFWQGVLRQQHSLDGALMEGPNYTNFIPVTMAREAYHPERNPNGTWPMVRSGNSANLMEADFWLQNTSYLRLKNFQLGYTIPQNVVANFRVYVSGENMLTFTETELFDPETPRGRSQFFPHSKLFSGGVNVTF